MIWKREDLRDREWLVHAPATSTEDAAELVMNCATAQDAAEEFMRGSWERRGGQEQTRVVVRDATRSWSFTVRAEAVLRFTADLEGGSA